MPIVAQAAQPMTVAQVVDAVVGVDTHRDTHTAHLATASGVAISACEISNDTTGYAELSDWIHAHTPGPRPLVGIEGTRSYGRGLATALTEAGLGVIECAPPETKTRRRRGKSDAIDAEHAAARVLNTQLRKLPTPRADGDREALRILITAREEMTRENTARINRLRALLGGGDDTDRDLGRASLTITRLNTLATRQPPRGATREHTVRQAEIRRLAVAIRDTRRELARNNTQLEQIIKDVAPGLLDLPGLGPATGARAIVSFSHPGRCRSDAAFAKLAGTAPLDASTGHNTHHRLNRGGDRQLNKATHTIAAVRMRDDPTTRNYVTRRTTEGKTPREIRRCLKRYITRQLYRHLTHTMTTTHTNPLETLPTS